MTERPEQKKNRLDSLRRSTDVPSDRTKELNLKYNIAALLCYVAGINLLLGPLWLLTEKGNALLRFHAMQGLVLTGAYFAVGIVLALTGLISLIPFLSFVGALAHTLWWMASIVYLGANIFMMAVAFNQNTVELPYVGAITQLLITREDPQ